MIRPLAVTSLVAACSGGNSPPESLDTACTTLSVTIEATRQLREYATSEYRSAKAAFLKWEKWNKKLVLPDEDGTGEYSGAAVREWMHRGAADALCKSASLTQDLIKMIPVADKDVQLEVMSVERILCQSVPSGPDYDRFLANWLAMKQSAYDLENAVIDACHKRLPRWEPPRPGLQPMLFMPETQ